MWSGCKDSQTSADTSEAGKATGAMSYAFTTALSACSFFLSFLTLLLNPAEQTKTRSKATCNCSTPFGTSTWAFTATHILC